MSSIDNRIVQMQFENSQFERGIKDSIASLEALEDKLQMTDGVRGLEHLRQLGDSFNLNNISANIDALNDRFGALASMGRRALENLTDGLYNTSAAMVKNLSVSNISTGWDKFEKKTKAVQTIMNSTGLPIDDVEAQLEMLQWFSDETSYNFGDMVDNIGKFTSMGVPLDEATKAMMGISNWAALSGQRTQQAAIAMYNLSQAIGLGTLKMGDWRSIANQSMGTPIFKETAINAAKALGILDKMGRTAKGTEVTIASFESSLAEGWLTKDVLLDTLGKFSDYTEAVYEVYQETGRPASEIMENLSDTGKELSKQAFLAAQQYITFADTITATKDAVSTGWMSTFQLIFGDYEHAKELWNALGGTFWEIFASGSAARNELLQLWNDIGGREELIQGLIDGLDGLVGIINLVKDTWHEIFPPMTAERLKDITDKVAKFGHHLKELYTIEQKIVGIKPSEEIKDINPLESLEKEFRRGERSDAVKMMQERLMQLGYSLDNFGADGIFGPETQAALEAFKKDYGLAIDDIYDESTHRKLGEALYPTKVQGFEFEYEDVLTPEAQKVKDNLTNIFRGIHKIFESSTNELKTSVGPTFKQGFVDAIMLVYSFITMNGIGASVINIVKGIVSAFSIFIKIIGFGVRVVGHIIKILLPFARMVLYVAGAIGEGISAFNEWLSTTKAFDKAFNAIKEILAPVEKIIAKVSQAIIDFFEIKPKVNGILAAPANLVSGLMNIFSPKNVGTPMLTFRSLWERLVNGFKNSKPIAAFTQAFKNLKTAINKISPTLKEYWKAFKESLGKKFTSFVESIPDKIVALSESISNLATGALNVLTGWIEKLPDAIEKIKGFWAALTFEGDEAAGKAPGLLTKIRNAFKSVVDFLFGEGDIENGKQPGLFKRLGAYIRGDLEAFTEGLDEETKTKVLNTIQLIKDFLQKVKEAITLLFGGELGEDRKLSDDAVKNINDFKQTVVDIFTAIGEFFTGVWNTVSGVFQNGIDVTTFDKFMGSLRGVWDSIVGGLETLGKNGESTAKTVGKTAITIVLLAVIGVIRAISSLIGVIKTLITGETDNKTILAIRGFIINIFNSVKGFIDSIVKVVSTLITGKIEDKVTAEKVKPVLDIINTVKDFFIDLWSKISGFFTEHFNAETLEQAKTFIIDIFNTVKGFFVGIWNSVGGFFQEKINDGTIERVKTFAIGVFNSVKDFFVNLWNTISGFFQEKINDGTIEQVKSFVIGIFNTVKDFLVDVWTSLMKLISGDTSDDKVNTVRSIITEALNSVGSFFTSIWTTMKELVTGDTDNEKILNFRNTVIGIFNAVKDAIISIFNTIKGLFTGEIKFDSIGGFITQVWEGIKGFAEQIGGVLSENYGKATNGLSTFFENAKTTFGKIAKWTIIGVIIPKVVRFLSNIGGITEKLKGVLGSLKGTAQPLSKSLMQFAIAVGIIAASIYALSTLEEDQLKRGMSAIREIFTAIGLFIIGSGLLSGMGVTKAIAKLGTALRDLAIGIGILAVIAFLLGHDAIAEKFNKGLWPLIKVMGLMVGLVVVIAILNKAFGPISASLKGLWELAVLIAVMAAIAWALGGVPEEQLKNGLWALFGIMAMVAGLFLVLGNIPNKQIKMKGLISLAVLIAVMAIVAGALGPMALPDLAKGIVALTIIMALIAGLALVMGAVSKDLKLSSMIVFFVGLAAVVWVFAEMIKSVKDVDPWVIVAFSAGLAVLIGVLTVALAALGAIPILVALKGCLNLVLVFAALGAAIWVFEHLIGSAMDDFGSKLYLISGDLSRFSNNMSGLSTDGANKVKDFVGIMTTVFTSLVSINYSKVDDFSAALIRLGSGVNLFNSLTSEVSVEKTKAIGDFASSINSALGDLTNLSTNADAITAALESVGAAIGIFYGNVAEIETNEDGEIDTESVQKAFDALGQLTIDESAMANIAQYANDDKGSTVNKFAEGVQNLSVAIGNYAKQIGGLNPIQVAIANSVLKTIASVKDQVTSVDNFEEFMGAISGKGGEAGSFTLFIADVVALGSALKQYGTDIGGLKKEDIVKANSILQAITNLKIPTTGGIIQWVTGTQDFGKFAANIARIGGGLKDYMNEISGATYDKNKISASLEPLKVLGDLQTQLTETGGLKNLVSGTRSVGTVGKQLKEFGGYLVEFSGSVKDFKKTQNITDALDVLSQVVTLQNSLSEDTTDFYSLEQIGYSLESFFNSLARIGSSSTADMLNSDGAMSLDDALEAAYWLNTDADPTAIIENITGYFTQIKDALSAEDSALIAMFKSMGFSLTETMSTGMTEAEFTGPDTVATNAVTALNDFQDDFKTVGGNFAVGLGNGINDWSWWPVLAAATVANKMVTTIQTIFDSRSPSKVTTQFGQYFTEGLAIGTKARIGDAESSAEQVANSMLDTASGTLSTLSSLLAEDIDDTPVIAPVVDLTNARATAAQIGSLFGNQDIGVTSQYMAKEAQLSTNNGRPVTIQNGSINTSEAVDGVNERLTALTNAISTQGVGTTDDPRSLADRFSDLAEAVTNLKIVLDSGVLVGEIMPAIDSGLGTYAMRRDRGN